MSIILKTFSIRLTVVFLFMAGQLPVFGQDLAIEIRYKSAETNVVEIEGHLTGPEPTALKNWVFADNYADASELASRINDLRLFDAGGSEIQYRKFAEGEIVAEKGAARFKYSVNLLVSNNITSAAHISWLKDSSGFLMLNDLIPVFGDKIRSANVSFRLPETWGIESIEKKIGKNKFNVEHIGDAVFHIGNDLRTAEKKIDGINLRFTTRGKWQFADQEATQLITQIFAEYKRILGKPPNAEVGIYLSEFPGDVGLDRWRAETRGSNVVLLSSAATFRSNALQRLHEQFRHELLHLWIPNGLNLEGNYAWFYEGFSVYQALKSGVWLGRIRFEDYLDTLSRAIYTDSRREKRMPLFEASKNRWADAGSSVYARGMLVGFLCDLALLRASNGKRDLGVIFKDLLRKHGKASAVSDANQAVIGILNSYPELRQIVEKQISGDEKVDWTTNLAFIGVEAGKNDRPVKLVLKSRLSSRQKALVRKLGYNRWRKLLRKDR